MAWFKFLYDNGFFDPSANPDPVSGRDGTVIPYWEALSYLEKLSMEIKEGRNPELLEDLLKVIENVSRHPKDNYRTWYVFIRILSNLPTEKISTEILNFIPVWFSGRFDTSLQSSEVFKRLLPNFLSDNATADDVTKAEIILDHLFKVERIEAGPKVDSEKGSFHCRVDLHFLLERFERNQLPERIAKHISSRFLLTLGRTVKMMLLDYPDGIMVSISSEDKFYDVKIRIEDGDLLIESKLATSHSTTRSALINFEALTSEELMDQLVSVLSDQGISNVDNEANADAFARIIFLLNNDLSSSAGFTSIADLGDRYFTNQEPATVFATVFRNILVKLPKFHEQESRDLLKLFCYDKKYGIPFFRRIMLHVVGENWENTKDVFWDVINGTDPLHLFSSYKYQKELFGLLDKNQLKLTSDEKLTLQGIIEAGRQVEKQDSDREYWKLGWYSALRKVEPFNKQYLELSRTLGVQHHHFENKGNATIRPFAVPPYSKETLLEKSNEEIVQLLKTFRPKDKWQEPNISGLNDVLKLAIQDDPEKFAREILSYTDIPYIYLHTMYYGFAESWKNGKEFNWQQVLLHCLQTIKSKKFLSGELQLESDTWNARQEWVTGAIAYLLSNGMRDDSRSFHIELLPHAKEILMTLTARLMATEKELAIDTDYPTYSLNSVAGKVLRALFDYSLRRARNFFKYEDSGKWEADVKNAFEETIDKNIIDGYILQGMYFEQFYFLDKEWITRQVQLNCYLDDSKWRAFISGFAFGNAPASKDLYNLFFPHYDRALTTQSEVRNVYNMGIIRHLTGFYFWGFESLSPDSLLLKFIHKSSTENVDALVNFIWQQHDYPGQLKEDEKEHFYKIIYELWLLLVEKFQDSDQVMGSLVKWIDFVPRLTQEYAEVILKSVQHIEKNFSLDVLLEGLMKLKDKGERSSTAGVIARILSKINFRQLFIEDNQDHLIDLVTFLFENGQSEAAMKFCNDMALDNRLFLKGTYDKFMAPGK